MPGHADTNVITIVDQGGVHGLQIFKKGQWMGVEPVPNALVIIIGCQLRVISIDKLTASEHRAMTNAKADRNGVGNFLIPSPESFIEPAKSLVFPPQYRAFQFKHSLSIYRDKIGDQESVMEFYRLQSKRLLFREAKK